MDEAEASEAAAELKAYHENQDGVTVRGDVV
jgi:hypothetical protein